MHHVHTACEMREAVMHVYDKADVIIKAAAVSDYRPRQFIPYKVKKTEEVQTIELSPQCRYSRRTWPTQGQARVGGLCR